MESFEEVYKSYFPTVYGYLLNLCRDDALAEELTQETFLRALQSIGGYRGDCKLSVWLCQIAKNLYFSYAKRRKRHVSLEELPEETIAAADPEEQVIHQELSRRVREVLQTLDEPYRAVFRMRAFGELPFAEIARLHGKTESWARVTYHRAKMKIQEELSWNIRAT